MSFVSDTVTLSLAPSRDLPVSQDFLLAWRKSRSAKCCVLQMKWSQIPSLLSPGPYLARQLIIPCVCAFMCFNVYRCVFLYKGLFLFHNIVNKNRTKASGSCIVSREKTTNRILYISRRATRGHADERRCLITSDIDLSSQSNTTQTIWIFMLEIMLILSPSEEDDLLCGPNIQF